jgi:hypothetical protein
MGIRKSVRTLARSSTGDVLVEVREYGPERGGALTYRFVAKPAAVVDFLVSSNFSPGGPSRPQRVSAAECTERVTALGEALAKHQFPGVTVHPDRCQTPSRDGLVVIAKS